MLRTAPRRLVPLAIVIALAASGCGVDEEPTGEPTPTASDTSSPAEAPSESGSTAGAGTHIAVTFEGDTVEPNGERVQAKAGEEISLDITADAPGEIHVHSSPEQELSYEAGTSTLTLTIEQPGVVEVESHDLDKVIVQLEVR